MVESRAFQSDAEARISPTAGSTGKHVYQTITLTKGQVRFIVAGLCSILFRNKTEAYWVGCMVSDANRGITDAEIEDLSKLSTPALWF